MFTSKQDTKNNMYRSIDKVCEKLPILYERIISNYRNIKYLKMKIGQL